MKPEHIGLTESEIAKIGPKAARVVTRLVLSCFGGDVELARHWLETHNHYFGQTPKAALLGEGGVREVLAYLLNMMNRY